MGGTARVAFAVLAAAITSCSGGGDENRNAPPTTGTAPSEATTTTGPGTGVTATCDALESLALAILGVHDATTFEEVQAAVDSPMAAFVDAADGSGDDELQSLAISAEQAFGLYGNDDADIRRAAGDAVDAVLDEAAQRCIELGTDNDFPEEPGS